MSNLWICVKVQVYEPVRLDIFLILTWIGIGLRSTFHSIDRMGLLPDTQNLRVRRECRERFPRHRGLAIPTYITARA